MKFFVIFGFTGVIAAGSNYWGARKFVEYSKHHTIEITKEGFKSVEFDTQTILPWNKVKTVKYREKRGSVSKLVLKTASNGTLDLSRYDNLDSLANELKGYIDSELWM